MELGYKGWSCCLRQIRRERVRTQVNNLAPAGSTASRLTKREHMANQKSPRPQQILRTDQSNDCTQRLISQVPNRAKRSGRRESCGMERRLSMAPERLTLADSRMARLAALTKDSLDVA